MTQLWKKTCWSRGDTMLTREKAEENTTFAQDLAPERLIDVANEIKHNNMDVKTLADLVNEALVQNKETNSRIQGLETTMGKMQEKIHMLERCNTSSDVAPIGVNTKEPAIDWNKFISPSINKANKTNLNPSPTQDVESDFAPTTDMLLFMSELKVACYVFHPEQPAEEVLFRVGNKKVTRLDFYCMCPEYEVTQEMVTLISMKTTYVEHDNENPTVWSLPPSFVDDVFGGQTTSQLAETYANVWMKPSENLKYVYIPIRNEFGHWFMMVISLVDKVVYHLDSHLGVGDDIERKKMIATLTLALSEVVTSGFGFYPKSLTKIASMFTTWDIEEATGIPNWGSSEDSAVWVIHWLKMGNEFNPDIICSVKPDTIRMKTTIELLTHVPNEERREIREKSEAFWDLIMNH